MKDFSSLSKHGVNINNFHLDDGENLQWPSRLQDGWSQKVLCHHPTFHDHSNNKTDTKTDVDHKHSFTHVVVRPWHSDHYERKSWRPSISVHKASTHYDNIFPLCLFYLPPLGWSPTFSAKSNIRWSYKWGATIHHLTNEVFTTCSH